MAGKSKPKALTEADRLDEVDKNPRVHQPTERDEEQLLQVMYGEPDADGVYGAPDTVERPDPRDPAYQPDPAAEPEDEAEAPKEDS